MVEIYLNIDGSQFSFLGIPLSDVQRLSIRPFKWLRYVMFCICGARGDFYATLDGPPVDYDSTALADDGIYFYKPSGRCIFVDHDGLNDRPTSSTETLGCPKFRDDVLEPDGSFCVITREPEEDCDAVYLIPKNKGDEYIDRVVRVRSPIYDGPTPSIRRIDAIENRVLLRTDLHKKLGRGDVALLKTPNYGLDPADIARVDPPGRVDKGPAPTDHYTLHHLNEPNGYNPTRAASLINTETPHSVSTLFGAGLHMDALFQGTGDSLPPTVILDYVYGVAAYRRWNSRRHDEDVHDVMGNYRNEYYVNIPTIPPSPRRHTLTTTGDIMAKAMDDLNAVLMSVHGITPQEATHRSEKRMEEEELKAQEASRGKVMDWMKTTHVSSL